MAKLIIPEAIVSVTNLQAISWLPWSLCSFRDQVAVFRFELPDKPLTESFLTILSPNEIARAQRYRRQEDQNRLLYAKYVLKVMLSYYMVQRPDEILFTTGINGKPELKDNPDWHFNVSHSGNWILVVIGTKSVGIDIEKIVPDFSFQNIVTLQFSLDEQRYIAGSSTPRLAFYQLWTRKEALIKATAKGMDDDFAQVPSLDGTHTRKCNLIGAAGNWTVGSFHVAADYSATVAYPATDQQPKFYTFESGLLVYYES